jgi:hypothetical protein
VSEDSTSPKKPTWVDDRFKPVQADDVTDERLVARRFDFFAAEMRQAIAQLANQILPVLRELGDTMRDMDYAIRRLESDRDTERTSRKDLARRVDALETRQTKRVRARK